MPPALSIKNLSFAVGGQALLHDLSMEMGEGEFIGLIGPNGAGKTTLFRLILGLLAPTSGQINLFGLPPIEGRAHLGYVPQYANFRRDFPIVVETAVLSGTIGAKHWWGGYNQAERATAQELMTALSIAHLAKRPLAKLSGGEMQRVLLARALVAKPRLLLLDEPTANVDNYREEEIFSLLAQLSPKPAILLISHDLGFITPMVNRVACLHQTLSMHTPESLTPNTIHALYGQAVHAVHHHH